MTAPPRSAMRAGASSRASGCGRSIAPQAAAIRTIHVSDAGRFGFARLKAAEQGIEAFGYVVANRVIGAALWKRLAAASGVVAAHAGTRRRTFRSTPTGVRLTVRRRCVARSSHVDARLVVAADGAHSSVRSAAGIEASVEDYEQVAIMANVAADRPHDGTAYERFTPAGPLAVLPLARWQLWASSGPRRRSEPRRSSR